MSTVLNRGPDTSAQFQETQVSASTTTQPKKSNVKQFFPEHILTRLKAAQLTLTFSVVIGRKSQG